MNNMETTIQIFNSPQFGEVRTAGTADAPLFCLADVCRALDLGNPSQVKARLSGGVISNEGILDNLGRTQYVNFVNEDGLYDVILDSRKPEARAFRKWITSEVLPSIRKHGAYATQTTIESIIADPESGIRLLEALKAEREQRRIAEEKVEEQAPKVVFADAIIGGKGSCLVGELAKILQQNGIDMGQNRLFKWLRDHHYLGKRGEFYNIPNQEYVERGLFEIKKNTHSENGVMKTTSTTKVTGKGQQYFINLFLGR